MLNRLIDIVDNTSMTDYVARIRAEELGSDTLIEDELVAIAA